MFVNLVSVFLFPGRIARKTTDCRRGIKRCSTLLLNADPFFFAAILFFFVHGPWWRQGRGSCCSVHVRWRLINGNIVAGCWSIQCSCLLFLFWKNRQDIALFLPLLSLVLSPRSYLLAPDFRLSPTIPPIQLPLNVLFTIFYYLPPKDSSPYISNHTVSSRY